MDIQRGDQVYYRGEVWEVDDVCEDPSDSNLLHLNRDWEAAPTTPVWTLEDQVQRVEQVR